MRGGVDHFTTSQEALFDTIAELLATNIASSIESKGFCSFVVSGGSTPVGVFKALLQKNVQWQNIDLFWSDERCVLPEHEDSNYGLAKKHLLSKVSVGNVYRMQGESGPELGASEYAATLSAYFKSNNVETLDVLFLGIGDDGHTASLFPESTQWKKSQQLAIGDSLEKLSQDRISLSAQVLKAGAVKVFGIKGEQKRGLLKEADESQDDIYPFQSILRKDDSEHWVILKD